jgi:hypothetical protein
VADLSIHAGDKEGFFEITRDLPAGPLDVFLHSPGGTAEGAESIVKLLRGKFTDIRFIVPIAAKSAATMLALSGNAIVMDDTSELGPTDPQRQFRRTIGGMSEVVVSPVMAIKETWERIAEESSDPAKLAKWYPIISQFGPSLLVECDLALNLSRSLVASWLEKWMFAARADPHGDAEKLADYLADHAQFGSHARAVTIDEAIAHGIEVVDLRTEENADLRRHIWPAWHAISLTLSNTGAAKMFENHLGTAQMTSVSIEQRIVSGQPPAGAAEGQAPARLPNRQERRAAKKRR